MRLGEGSTAEPTSFEFVEDGFSTGFGHADALGGVEFEDLVIRGFRR